MEVILLAVIWKHV